MTGRLPTYALTGDLAASVLATALIVVLVVMMQAAGGAPTPRPAETMPGFHRQKPLGGGEAVTFLFDRRPGAAGTSIDVHDDRIVVAVAGVETTLPCRAAMDVESTEPVRVAVFRSGCLGPVLARLAKAGIEPRVLSVPAALRSPGGDAWSERFRRLLDRAEDLAGFSRSLAVLLSRSATLRPGGGVAGGDGGAPAPASLLERARTALTGLAGGVAVLSALAIFVVAERRRLSALSHRL